MVLAHKRNYKLAVLVDEHDLKLKIEETKSPLLDHTQLIRPHQPSSGPLSRGRNRTRRWRNADGRGAGQYTEAHEDVRC
jgi:hypothetical protein